MKPLIIWTAILILPLAIVGGMERRYQALDAELAATVQLYESRLDMVIEDAAGMEAEIEAHKFHRSRPFQDDMNSEEFLKVLTDYLARDGRCKVVIHRVDWSTWVEAY